MRIKLILFSILLLNQASAQQTFLTYRIHGVVKLKTGKETKGLNIGQLLKTHQVLSLDKGASVVLICEGYNSFLIHKNGDHILSGYLDSCKKDDHSITTDYFRYVWDELTHPHTTPENNRRKYMQNTGAVVRGCPGITIDPVYDTIYNHTGDARIEWKTSIANERTSFVLFDSEKEGRLLYTRSTIKNNINMDIIRKHSGKNKEVYWNITINGNEMCPRKLIKFKRDDDYDLFIGKIKNGLKMITDKAERYYATGFLLEANHFLAEACTYYERAAALQPAEIRYRQPLLELK